MIDSGDPCGWPREALGHASKLRLRAADPAKRQPAAPAQRSREREKNQQKKNGDETHDESGTEERGSSLLCRLQPPRRRRRSTHLRLRRIGEEDRRVAALVGLFEGVGWVARVLLFT
ncbi:hypothetical protein PVAP13_7KG130700 [Panicum virgatum]|uniref:Uncharacterized protein n=1 Tax=Panicum virgatum TaxID=38727 RepID=A0A8T0QC84_PANVG|nr:hypothetical protein PVAP13_7KG130700 [Panicum virgatum]